MQAGVRWLSEQTRRGRLQLRNKKGRGIGQGGAMLCATLALIIFGSVFGLHVMDATITHSGESSLHQGSDWKQSISNPAQEGSPRLRSNKMLLTGADSTQDNLVLAHDIAKQKHSSNAVQSRPGSSADQSSQLECSTSDTSAVFGASLEVQGFNIMGSNPVAAGCAQKKADPVGLWQQQHTASLAAASDSNATFTTSQGAAAGKLPITDASVAAGTSGLLGSKSSRDSAGFYKVDFGVGGQQHSSGGSRASDFGGVTNRNAVRPNAVQRNAGQQTDNQAAAEQSKALTNPVDHTHVVHNMKPREKLSGLSDSSSRTAFQGVSSPVTNALSGTDRSQTDNPLQGVTLPSLGASHVSPMTTTKLSTQTRNASEPGQVTAQRLPGDSLPSQRQAAAASGRNGTTGVSSLGAAQQNAVVRRRPALPGMPQTGGTRRETIQQPTDRLSAASQGLPQRDSGTGSLAGTGSKSTAGTTGLPNSTGSAGSAGLTGSTGSAGVTGSTDSAGLIGSAGSAGIAGSSPAAVSKEAEAMALAARESGNLALEPLIAARDAHAYKAAQASLAGSNVVGTLASSRDSTAATAAQAARAAALSDQPQTALTTSSAAMDPAVTSLEAANSLERRADLATGSTDPVVTSRDSAGSAGAAGSAGTLSEAGSAGTTGTAGAAGTAGTAGIRDTAGSAGSTGEAASLDAGNSALEPLTSAAQGQGSTLAAENRALEPLISAEDAATAERAAEASLRSEQDLLESDSSSAVDSLSAAREAAVSDAVSDAAQAETLPDAASLPLDWDWKTYLNLNSDVAHEMGNNQQSAEVHYMVHGRREQRPYKLPAAGEVPTLGSLGIVSDQPLQQGTGLGSDTESAANAAGATLIQR